MHEIIDIANNWLSEGKQIALATVITTWGSSPRKVDAQMVVNSSGEFSGSVSGGCVESAVIDFGIQVIKTNKPQLVHFGVANETAWEVGLACGGEIDIFIQPIDKKFLDDITVKVQNERPVCYSFVIDGPNNLIGQPKIIHEDTEKIYPRILVDESQEGKSKTFINCVLPPPTLILVGGVHIAIKLAQIAKILDYKVIIIDPRGSISAKYRFKDADQILKLWPKEGFENLNIRNSTAIVTLSHDPKIDDPALLAALRSSAFYIGALGSKHTQAERAKRLKANGISEKQIRRIHGPVGLKIGSGTPSEIALSIIAEIVDVRKKMLFVVE